MSSGYGSMLANSLLKSCGCSPTPAARKALARAAREELNRRRREAARSGLVDFTCYTFGMYHPDPAHRLLGAALERVIAGDLARLMIFAPPQHGKSELASVRMPAFWLAQRPDDPIILTSYAASLAYNKSRQARNVLESTEFGEVFPDIETDRGSRAVDHWELAYPHRGGMLAAGVGGPITGHGAALGIIDDPFENWQQAHSQLIRDRVWDWYRTTFRTRVWENGAIVVIMCMVGGTRILMADGTWRPLDTIRPGEKVMTWRDGQLAVRVVEVFLPQGKAQVFQVKTGNHTVTATGNHPFLIYSGNGLEWVRADELKKGDNLVVLGRWAGGDNPRQLTGEDCWALGFMYGDGWLTLHPRKRSGAMRWVTCVARGVDESVNRRIVDYFETQFRTKLKLKRREGYYRTEVAAAGRWFESLGFGGTAKTKRIPDHVFGLPLELRRAFVLGFTDADGHIDKHNRANVVSANRLLLEDLKLLAEGCGHRTSNITFQSGIWQAPNSPEPTLSIYYHFSFSVCNCDEETFTIKPVREVKIAGVQPVYDLTVADTHNFIAEGCVVHNTRWHEDDLAGRLLLDQGERWEVLRLPALGETQEDRNRRNKRLGQPLGQPDPLGREPGEALCPSRYSAEALAELRRDVGSLAWEGQYMGSPTLPEGNRFKRQWFPIVEAAPAEAARVRYWDFAGSESERAARTAGVRMAGPVDGVYYVEHVVVGKWTTGSRNEVVRQTAATDGVVVKVRFEQEPGSSGLDTARNLVQFLAGFAVEPDRVTGSKDVRLEPFAAQAEAGNVRLVRGDWNGDYIEEMCAVPNGRYRDQADASAGAFNALTAAPPKLAGRSLR